MKHRLLFLILLPFLSCSDKNNNPNQDIGSVYFSVTQFLDDQWEFLRGQPYLLVKKIDINGNVDSGVQQLDSVFFFNLREIFDKTDISSSKYKSQYDYFYTEETMFHTLTFIALDEDLYTQLLVINMDYENNKILNIYIETNKETLFHDKTSKLTYAPQSYIQIIEKEKSFLSAPKNIEMNYVF